MSQAEEVCECKKEERCKRDAGEREEYDPRSFCHNICAAPKNVCVSTVCNRTVRDDEVTCIPKRVCKMIRHFGPGSGLDSYSRSGRRKSLSTIDSEGSQEVDDEAMAKEKQMNLKNKLETLKNAMTPEDMAAVYALAGSDICPCCGCSICQCELRHTGLKEGLFMKRWRHGDLMQQYLETGGEGVDDSMFGRQRRDGDLTGRQRRDGDLTGRQRRDGDLTGSREMDGEGVIEEYLMAMAKSQDYASRGKDQYGNDQTGPYGYGKPYAYTFDYFEKPDLEAYEKIKELQREEEIKEKVRREISKQMGKQKRKKDGKKDIRPSEIIGGEVLDSAEEEEKDVLSGEEQSIISVDDYAEIRSLMEKIEGWRKHGLDKYDWVKYKEAEWGGIRMQEKYSVLEEEALRRIEELIKQGELPPSDAIQRSGPYEEPQEDLRAHPSMRTSIDDLEKDESLKLEKIPLSGEDALEFVGPVDEHQKYFARLKDEFLGEVCDCLPGLCTCGKQHYTFKRSEDGSASKMGQSDIIVPLSKEDKDFSEVTLKSVSSCSCVHSSGDTQVTPRVSRMDVVAYPPPQKPKRFLRCREPKYQKTLVIVKPEAVQYKEVIVRAIIYQEGLDIVDERLVQLTPEQVAEIYFENFGSAYFALYVRQMSSSPVLALTLAGIDAIQRWKKAVTSENGIPASWFYPDSMRRRFSVNEDIQDAMKLSDEFLKATKEIRYFFPFGIIDPIIIASTFIQDYCDEFIHPTLIRGLKELLKLKPLDPVLFLAEWLLINNPFQPFYMQKEVSLAAT